MLGLWILFDGTPARRLSRRGDKGVGRMVAMSVCPTPSCGRPSRLAGDGLGRMFRCARCGTRLPRATVEGDGPAGPSAEAPWESEGPVKGRRLGSVRPGRVGCYRVGPREEA